MARKLETQLIMARRVRPEMHRVRQVSDERVIDPLDRVRDVRRVGPVRLAGYPVVIRTVRHPDGLYYGPHSRCRVLA